MCRAFALCAILLLTLSAIARADMGLEALGYTVEYLATSGAEARPDIERPADALPDGIPDRGFRDIARIWLIAPTDRYDHGVLGDTIEAGGLRAILSNGQTAEFHLGDNSVFEDLRPRLADLDGDGRDEIIVVRSYLDAGAALAVFGVRGGRLELLAETSPVGQAHRWLNPVGVGDFDGDGRLEIAYVETPHIGGVLRIVALESGRLVEKGAWHGFSNHVIGSRAMRLSLVFDIDGDGSDDILIPRQGRRQLSFLSFAGGSLREFAKIDTREPVQGNFYGLDLEGRGREDIYVVLRPGLALLLKR